MIPGEMFIKDGEIELNVKRKTVTIAVANTTIFNTRAGSSSTGPAVTVAAPGTGIFSTIPVVDGSYQFKTGTSMACPHVAGCIALMIQAGVSDVNRDGSFKDEILQVITETAIDLGPPGQDNIFGVGLIQVDKACKKIIDGISPPTGGPVFGKPTNLTASASGSTVTLRWNDNSNVETSYQIRFGSKVGSTITWRGSWEVASDTTSVRRTMPSGYWYFEVRAVQGVNLTDWSNTAGVSVP